jgi:hypothetical protein
MSRRFGHHHFQRRVDEAVEKVAAASRAIGQAEHAAPNWERRPYCLLSSRKTSACDPGISGDERYGGE